jgi:peptidyl-prolyl cis-trans isomerase SurA
LVFFASFLARAEMIEKIVAVVNNEIITLTDINKFNIKLQKGGMIDDLLLFDHTTDELKNNRRLQLDFLINEKVVDSEVKRLNLSVTIERVEQEIREIAKRNNVSRNEMLEALKGQGVSVADYQDFIKKRIERQSLIEGEISSKIRITDEDILGEYLRSTPQADKSSFEYTVAHILFLPSKGGQEAALQRANKVLEKLKAGESFEVLAQQYSEDPGLSSGGLLGKFKSGEFSKELEDAVQGLKPGETSSIVRSRAGFHIVKLLNKTLITDPNFEAAKEKIRAQLFEKAFKQQLALWLQQKKEEAFLKINE